MYTALMGKVRNAADLSTTMLKSLLKLFGFAQVAGMVEGGEELCKLLNDIKNGRLGDPNVEMIRSLHSVMHTEFDRIEAELKIDGADSKRVKQTLSILLDATDTTIRQLADDERKLLQAMQEPDSFADLVKREAVALSDNSDERMQAHYERLLEAVAAEYLSLAQESPRFNELALIDLLRCFPELEARVQQAERAILKAVEKSERNLGKQITDSRDSLTQEIARSSDNIIKEIRNKATKTFSIHRFDTGIRPAPLAHSVPRSPNLNGKTLQQTIFESTATDAPTHNVLVGIPGSGKTQIAASIADKCNAHEWSMVAWFDASSRSRIEEQYITFGESTLGIVIDPSESRTQSIGKILARLNEVSKDKMLFVFDNVETINDLIGLLPTDLGTSIVVTTRKNSGWDTQAGWNVFQIDNFTRHESVEYLTKVINDNDRISATKLASYLGDLPLAIAQAAVMTKRYFNADISDYYTYLQSQHDEDLEELLEPIEGNDYSQGAIQALRNAKRTTLSKIASNTVKEEAIKILDSLCYLDEAGVPTNWLKHNSDFNRSRAYQALIDSSLIEPSDDEQFTRIHRLLARSMRTRSTYSTSVTNATDTLNYALQIQLQADSLHFRMQNLRHLSTQVRAICQNLLQAGDSYPHTFNTVIIDTLRQAYDFGMFDCATVLYTTVYQFTPPQKNELAWLTILDFLGINLCALRKFDEAHSVYKMLFSAIDNTHFLYYIYRGHLARLLYFERKDMQALEICKNTLENTDLSDPFYGIYEYEFAKMTIDTTDPFERNNEAHVHNANTAIRYAHLAIYHTGKNLHEFEPRHRINSWMTMAEAYSALDQHTEAIRYSTKALNALLHQVDSSHPDVYTCKFNRLAYSKRSSGVTQAIVDELRTLVSDLEDQYTTFNPEAFTMHCILAKWLFEAKRYQESISEFELCITASESLSETTDPPVESLYALRNKAISQLAQQDN